MKRTSPLHLALLALIGGVVTWLTEVALTASGRAIVIPPFSLAVALVLAGVAIVVLAVPVRRAARGPGRARIDPFYATRVVMLAQASSLSGALLGGGGLGIVGYLLTRAVVPASIASAVASGAAAILLLAAGLIAEHMCVIPPDDDDDGRPGSGPATTGAS